MDQLDLWGAAEMPAIEPPTQAMNSRRPLTATQKLHRKSKTNPMVEVYGAGPDGARCGDCIQFITKHFDKSYHKCLLRGDSNGPGTDQRVRWQACVKYEARGDTQRREVFIAK